MQSTLTSKGQVTLPKKLRDIMHLRAGDKVGFVVDENSNIVVIPLTSPVTKLKGMVPPTKKVVSLEDMDEAIAKGVKNG